MASFGGAAAAFGLATSPVFAQSAPEPTQVAMLGNEAANSSTIQFLDDADDAASEWVADHSERVAVSIRLGGATTFTPEFIQDQIQQVLVDNGVTNAVFFWEHGLEDGGTSVAVETDDMTFGPFGLSRELLSEHVPRIANQIRFNTRFDIAQNTNTLN